MYARKKVARKATTPGHFTSTIVYPEHLSRATTACPPAGPFPSPAPASTSYISVSVYSRPSRFWLLAPGSWVQAVGCSLMWPRQVCGKRPEEIPRLSALRAALPSAICCSLHAARTLRAQPDRRGRARTTSDAAAAGSAPVDIDDIHATIHVRTRSPLPRPEISRF